MKLTDELKTCIAPLAEAAGENAACLMVEALEAQAALAEMRGVYCRRPASAAEVDAGGPLYAAEDVHAYIVARAGGMTARQPKRSKAQAVTRRCLRRPWPPCSYSARALADLDHLFDFLAEHDPTAAVKAAALIVDAVEVLARHPNIGRPVRGDLREPVISHGRTGYVALYRVMRAA